MEVDAYRSLQYANDIIAHNYNVQADYADESSRQTNAECSAIQMIRVNRRASKHGNPAQFNEYTNSETECCEHSNSKPIALFTAHAKSNFRSENI
jgi:hypothetical protein